MTFTDKQLAFSQYVDTLGFDLKVRQGGFGGRYHRIRVGRGNLGYPLIVYILKSAMPSEEITVDLVLTLVGKAILSTMGEPFDLQFDQPEQPGSEPSLYDAALKFKDRLESMCNEQTIGHILNHVKELSK